MHKIHIFEVSPRIPERLQKLIPLAYNIHWSWEPQCIDLFRRLDSDLWEEVDHNPVKLLRCVSQERYLEVQDDDGFIDHMERAMLNLEVYLMERSWFQREHPDRISTTIAYFSAEFGLHECMAFYSGGLGVLSGDHMKSASDLGIPLVGVGLLYQKGYFQQYLNADGWQQETYRIYNFTELPLQLLRDEDGKPFKVSVKLPEREVVVQCWKADIGRVPLYLLDTNIPENRLLDQNITDELYGGDLEKRIQQEIVLGIGGYRMLRKLGINPTVFHMNEGHSAFLALEHIRYLM
nr:alpha-glucan family phosphorylase [FCB group bacterium]